MGYYQSNIPYFIIRNPSKYYSSPRNSQSKSDHLSPRSATTPIKTKNYQ